MNKIDINVVVQNAENNSESDWTALLGCKNGLLVSSLFKKIKESDETVINNNVEIPLFIEEFAKKVLMLRLISGWLEIHNKEAFIPISKIIHEYLKYMVNLSDDEGVHTNQTSAMMEQGLFKYITDISSNSKKSGINLLNGGARFEQKIEGNDNIEFVNLVYRSLIQIVISLLPKANIDKGGIENVTKNINQNFSLVPRNAGVLQQFKPPTTSYPISGELYQANLTKSPTYGLNSAISVTPPTPMLLLNRNGRQNTRKNVIVRYEAGKIFSDEHIFTFLTNMPAMPKSLPNANPAEVSGPQFFNITIPQYFKDMYSRYAIASGFNHKIGESSFVMYQDKSGELQIGKNITYGTRSSVNVNVPLAIPMAKGHLHPLEWQRYTSPASDKDINANIIYAFAFGIFNDLVFTQGGLVTIMPDDSTLEFIKNIHSNKRRVLDIVKIIKSIVTGTTDISLKNWIVPVSLSYLRNTIIRSFIIPNNEKYKIFFTGKYEGLTEFKVTSITATYDWSLTQIALAKPMNRLMGLDSLKFPNNLNFPFKHTRKPHHSNLLYVNNLFRQPRARNLQKTLIDDFRKFTTEAAIIKSTFRSILELDPILDKMLEAPNFNALGIKSNDPAYINRTRVENLLLDVVFGLGKTESEIYKKTAENFEFVYTRGESKKKEKKKKRWFFF